MTTPYADPMSSHADNDAAHRQQRLLQVLACPNCRSAVELSAATTGEGFVFDADLMCPRCGSVGIISSGYPSFLRHDVEAPEIPRGLFSQEIGRADLEDALLGSWSVTERSLLGQAVGARISGSIHGAGVAFEVMAHAWSGRVVLELAGTHTSVDLYSPSAERRLIVLDGVPDGEHTWSATVAAGGDASRLGDQLVLLGVRSLVPADRAQCPQLSPVNRGNPYPQRFDELVSDAPLDAVIVDLGGGDRRHDDPRVLNMEYLPYRAIDFRGDGLRLPLRDGSVDLILSQAVLEHVPEPSTAVAEMLRVLRPGGVVYAEIAFMQPLHAVPFHYFNVTPHGATLLFQNFDVIRKGWFGGLAETMGWMLRLVDADQRIGSASTSSMLSDLARLDATLSDDELAHVASAVFVEARRPSAR